MTYEKSDLAQQIASRLDLFIAIFYKTKAEFAETIGITPQSLNHYTKDASTMPTAMTLWRFYLGGINLNWLIVGDGQMTNGTEYGQRLEQYARARDEAQRARGGVRNNGVAV